MQHIQDGQWEDNGCFVFRVLKSVEVRSTINVGNCKRTGLSFSEGDFVSIDLIRPSRIPGSTNGPFLRLSDCSGWLFEYKYSEKYLQRLPVEEGLWPFYVDNCPVGMALRQHPFDGSPYVKPKTSYQSMQLIYCDRRVIAPNGVKSYRVQGTEGWVFDKRLKDDGTVKDFMLLPETSVRSGLFAFKILEQIKIHSKPNIDSGLSSDQHFNVNDVVCCDIVRESPICDGNGPFVRLTDGSGWLFQRKSTYPEPLLEEIPIEKGNWVLNVVNVPHGIRLRRHPIDGDMKYETSYNPKEHVRCDRKIVTSDGVNFFRVTGTQGWVFNKRGASVMMNLVEEKPLQDDMTLSTLTDSWSIDFIRGVALAYGLEEIMCNPQSRVISFRNEDNTRVNVYYTTRTIGTAVDHPSQGKMQLFRRNCTSQELVEILQNPCVHTGSGYKQCARIGEKTIERTHHGVGVVIDEEEVLRNSILDVDDQIRKLATKRRALLKSLKVHDDKRAQVAAKMKELMQQRMKEFQEKM